jgi:(2R)-3-sulfolactate dehydrogenase (NADP+)
MQRLAASITEQEGARLPGQRRAENRIRIEKEGVEVDDALLKRIAEAGKATS